MKRAARFLFVHQNFPGQFRHLAPALAARGHEVVALGERANVQARRGEAPGVRLLGYAMPKESRPLGSPFAVLGATLERARLAAHAAQQLRAAGFQPDAIYAHIGWGEALFLKDVFPEAALLVYGEFFYAAAGADTGFDREFTPARTTPLSRRVGTRLRNTPLLMALEAADAVVAPTRWQRSRFPAVYHDKVQLVHDGIDTVAAQPSPKAAFALPGTQRIFGPGEPVVTYAARNLEPYRGFHIFMRAVPEIQARNPKAQIVVVGGDRISYSPRLPQGQTYRQRALREIENRFDPARLHFIPRLPYQDYLSLLQVSAAHVYLTYPFVLSWSLLEAMAVGGLVIASRTAPVEEVVRDGENGLLFDFFSPGEIAEHVTAVLEDGRRHAHLREAERKSVREQFDLREICLPRQVAILEGLAERRPGAVA